MKTSFLGIRDIPNGTVETIYNKVVEMLMEANLDLKHKLTGNNSFMIYYCTNTSLLLETNLFLHFLSLNKDKFYICTTHVC